MLDVCSVLRCELEAFVWFISFCIWQNNIEKHEMVILVFRKCHCNNVITGANIF